MQIVVHFCVGAGLWLSITDTLLVVYVTWACLCNRVEAKIPPVGSLGLALLLAKLKSHQNHSPVLAPFAPSLSS